MAATGPTLRLPGRNAASTASSMGPVAAHARRRRRASQHSRGLRSARGDDRRSSADRTPGKVAISNYPVPLPEEGREQAQALRKVREWPHLTRSTPHSTPDHTHRFSIDRFSLVSPRSPISRAQHFDGATTGWLVKVPIHHSGRRREAPLPIESWPVPWGIAAKRFADLAETLDLGHPCPPFLIQQSTSRRRSRR